MKTPKISEAEWEVMKVLWADSPRSAAEVIDALQADDPARHPRTIKTLLARLVKKRALAYEKHGRAYQYRPLVRQEECVAAASDSFLERVFGGSLQPMLAFFVGRRKLSRREIEELRRLLDRKED
ncbi:MAG TPA: BlaI/MecI/CopY family transcriptional regulator [Verrucomicrobiae bacterium]|nr:BlaI/MecI/CopY family transcriptional regulator [Verrucomicrobiae bacterium]